MGLAERERLFKLHGEGWTMRRIATTLGRDVSTISRELRRNRHEILRTYLPDTAQRKSDGRKRNGRKARYVDKNPKLGRYIQSCLAEDWSPEQISGRMREETGWYLNLESIYQYVYSLDGPQRLLRMHLRRRHAIRRRKRGRKVYHGKIGGRVDISLRPASVESRSVFGHWEGDSMQFQGQRQMLATHTERKTRYMVVLDPQQITAKARSSCMIHGFEVFPKSARRSMTVDNGHEFSDHKAVTQSLDMPFYFARPYASYQRGTCENQNGLLRWYLPRSVDLRTLAPERLKEIVAKINNRPRKCLNFRKPAEVFYDELKKAYRKANRCT